MNPKCRVFLFVVGMVAVNMGAWHLVSPYHRTASKTDSAILDGLQCKSMVDANGTVHSYITFTPFRLQNDVPPAVILYLNGFGENGDDGLMQIFENFGQPVWEMKRRFPFVVVAPQCPIGETWNPDRPPIQQALKILDHVCAATNADSDRVFLVGVSSGAGSVWSIATHFPDRFAGIVPISSARPSGDTQETASAIAHSGIPVWAGFNRRDKEEFTEFNREMKSALLHAGSSPHYFEYNARGHDCWSRTFRSPALYHWLLGQSRRTQVSEPFRLIDVNNVAESFESAAGANWSAQSDGILRSPVSLETDGFLLSREPVRDFEIHAEFLTAPDAKPGVVLQLIDDDSKGQTNWTLTMCGSEAGGSDLSIDTPREWIADIDPLAQRSISDTEWNDVRLSADGETLRVEVNGWSALQVSDKRLAVGMKRFGLFQAKASATPTEWRWIRVRTSTDARRIDRGTKEQD